MPTFTCNDATLDYDDRGDGDPIVFLPRLGRGRRYFAAQLEALPPAYRTVTLDFRGHGRSEPTDRGHTIPQYAADVAALLDHLDLDDVVLVGWSTGALVAWEYVDRVGTDRLRGLVSIDMEPSPLKRDGYDWGRYDVDALRECAGEVQTGSQMSVEEYLDSRLYYPLSDTQLRTIQEDTQTPPAIASALSLELTRDYRDVLPTIDVPMLVCASTAEPPWEIAGIDAVVDLVPEAKLVSFPQSRSCPPFEEPDRFNDRLETFVDALSTTPS